MVTRELLYTSIGALLVLLVTPAILAQPPERSSQSQALMPVLSGSEVRDYAQALVLVSQIRETEKSQAAEMPDAPRGALNAQLHEQVSAILQRFDLDRPTFNRISALVESDPKLRQRIQQLVIKAQVDGDT